MKLLATVAIIALQASTPAAIPSVEQKARDAFVPELRDPMGAQFIDLREVRMGDNPPIICGQFNAKNAYGAYVGFKPFAVHRGKAMYPDDTQPDIAAISRRLIALMCDPKPSATPANGT